MTQRMTALILTALMVLAGCGQDDSNKPRQLAPLALKEQASSVVKASGGYVVNWAAVLGNPNRWHFGENTVATISAQDATGKEIVRMEQPLDAVPPAGTLAFTGEALAAAKPVSVKINYRPAAWHQAARIPSAFKPFPVSKVATEKLGTGSYLITGYVTDPFQKPASSLVVTALLRDKAGKLIGGGTAFVDDVRSNTNRRFIITVESVSEGGQAASTEVVARTWGATAKPYEDLAMGGAKPVHTAKPQTEPFIKDRGIQAMTEKRP
ncbi:hypothetical protein GCM10009555_028760 [Acrocarpospora macrocephala]|uniref:Lipoprotein n=2 Tax=Acrocarpospora macrocephala TaxID=150177 RepID=A0A5M3WRT6_9ACTN|nr:hypothetical protein Amac_048130 [Acrocarpospora macrocephala]